MDEAVPLEEVLPLHDKRHLENLQVYLRSAWEKGRRAYPGHRRHSKGYCMTTELVLLTMEVQDLIRKEVSG